MMMTLSLLLFFATARVGAQPCKDGKKLKPAKCPPEAEVRSYELKVNGSNVNLDFLGGNNIFVRIELNSTSYEPESFVTSTLKFRLDVPGTDTRCSRFDFPLWEDALWVFGKTGDDKLTELVSVGFSPYTQNGTNFLTISFQPGVINKYASFGESPPSFMSDFGHRSLGRENRF